MDDGLNVLTGADATTAEYALAVVTDDGLGQIVDGRNVVLAFVADFGDA